MNQMTDIDCQNMIAFVSMVFQTVHAIAVVRIINESFETHIYFILSVEAERMVRSNCLVVNRNAKRA